jgi:cytoskeleton protein RodZ
MSDVGSFGDKLRREREMRGVSLDDIAEATKIGTRSLRALEEEHFELLPGGIFNKGFVRAYAKYLGLNEDEAVADYLAAAGESSPDPRLIAEQNAGRIDRTGMETGSHRRPGFPIIPVLILLLVIAAGAGGWQIYQQRVRERQTREDAARAVSATTSQPSGVASEPSSSAAPVPISAQPSEKPASVPSTNSTTAPASTGTQPALPAKTSDALNASTKAQAPTNPAQTLPAESAKAKPAMPPDQTTGATTTNAQPFEVTIRAKDRAWVSIKSDGKYTVRGIISANDVKTVHATDQIIFWTGNAGAVEISFNGQRVSLEGGPNTEGVLVFNSHGVVIPRPAVANQP